MTATATKIRRGFKAIPGASNYAINRKGEVYNINTNRNLTPDFNKKHWSGAVRLTDNLGKSYSISIYDLMVDTYPNMSERQIENALNA